MKQTKYTFLEHFSARQTLCASLFVLLSLVSFQSYAQDDLFDLPLESLLQFKVKTASKYSENLYEAPGVITVLSRDDIERYGAVSLRDVVGRLPGLMLLTDGDIQNDNLGVRGDSVNLNNHVLMLINGHPFRSVPGASDAIRRLLNSFPVDLVDRIEYIRGPGSALYSTSAYTAIINVITTSTHDQHDQVSIGGGSNNARFASVTKGHVDKETDLNVIFNASGWKDDGWRAELTDVNLQQTEIEIGEEYKTVSAFATYQNWNAALFTGSRDSDTFGQRPGFAPSILEDEHVYSSIGYDYIWSPKVNVSGNFSWLHLNVNSGQFKDDEYLLEIDVTKKQSESLKWIAGLSTLKTEFLSNLAILKNYDIDTTQVYGQLDYAVYTNTHLVLGGQANRTEGQELDFVPRLGLIHQFSEALGMKLLYNQAYRNPNAIETGTFIPNLIEGNAELSRETVETAELELFYHASEFHGSLAFFNSKQKDLISPTFNSNLGILQYTNASERRFYGAEFAFGKMFSATGFKLDGSLTYQRNEQTTEPEIDNITTLPNVLGKLGFAYENGDFTVGIWDNYVSSFRENPQYKASKLYVNEPPDSYHYVTANARWAAYQFTSQKKPNTLYLNLYVQNVLDEDIRQLSLQNSTPLNAFPSETDRAIYVTAELEF